MSAEDIEKTLSKAEAIRAVKEAFPELAFPLLPVNRVVTLEGT